VLLSVIPFAADLDRATLRFHESLLLSTRKNRSWFSFTGGSTAGAEGR